MTALYFVIAALALIGAGILLWLDRRRSHGVDARASWADSHDFTYQATDQAVSRRFHAGGMDVVTDARVLAVADGRYHGRHALVFDLGDALTVAGVQGSVASDVVVDLRHEDALAPSDEDLAPLGAMGERVMFANDLEIARRVCDRRMIALATNAPGYLEVIWNEGEWALAAMPRTDDADRIDTALETARRYGDLLRVLPPVQPPAAQRADARDPHAPVSGRMRAVSDPARRSESGRGTGVRSEATRAETARSDSARPEASRAAAVADPVRTPRSRGEATREDSSPAADSARRMPTTQRSAQPPVSRPAPLARPVAGEPRSPQPGAADPDETQAWMPAGGRPTRPPTQPQPDTRMFGAPPRHQPSDYRQNPHSADSRHGERSVDRRRDEQDRLDRDPRDRDPGDRDPRDRDRRDNHRHIRPVRGDE